jgi:hypothetical protein
LFSDNLDYVFKIYTSYLIQKILNKSRNNKKPKSKIEDIIPNIYKKWKFQVLNSFYKTLQEHNEEERQQRLRKSQLIKSKQDDPKKSVLVV